MSIRRNDPTLFALIVGVAANSTCQALPQPLSNLNSRSAFTDDT